MFESWSRVWHQAVTQSFLGGKAFGWNKTVTFCVTSPVEASAVRLRFSNRFGSEPYKIGGAVAYAGGQGAVVRMGGLSSFEIPVGSVCHSDTCDLPMRAGDTIELRIYYTSPIVDCNMIEAGASLVRGNMTRQPKVPFGKPLLARALGAYNAIPAIDAVEVLTSEPARAIVAFGDSITALSQWTKPLEGRLASAYPGQYVLLNSGISGNCLLYEPGGVFGPVFGEMGTKRFARDVLEVPNMDAVIIALGVNDVSYLGKPDAEQITFDNYVREVTNMVDVLHGQGIRVTMQTITPRLGCAPTMGVFTQEMEAMRLELNGWIRTSGIFDYVFDAEEVVSERREDGLYFAKGLHMGDHLHPNAKGGQLLADAFDLAKLTGRS